MPLQLPARRLRPCRTYNLIGPAMIRLRHEREWTQEDLVGELHMLGHYATRCIIANLETGRSGANDTLIHALADAFGVPESELFPPRRPGQALSSRRLDPVTVERRRRAGPHCGTA